LICRSISKSASKRLTASSAIGEIGLPLRLLSRALFSMSASSKNFRLAWAWQKANVIGLSFLCATPSVALLLKARWKLQRN